MIGQEELRKLKGEHPIEEVISQAGIPLVPSGKRRLKAQCPFPGHEDSTPSFFVFCETQTFKCFGCGRGGDVLDFVQEWYLYSFPDAVNWLAGSLKAPRTRRRSAPTSQPVHHRHLSLDGDDPDLLAEHTSILTLATTLYQQILLRHPAVLAYAKQRGIVTESVRDFRLGYADGRTLPAYIEAHIHLREAALKSGLLGEDGRETLTGRLVFPEVRDGVTWYLIGRIVPPATSKYRYLGLPLTKPLLGYGDALALMQQERLRHRGVLVVEGAIDRIIAVQWGLPVYPVALISAWAGPRQIREIIDLHHRSGGAAVLLGHDNDAAGQAATVGLLLDLRSWGIPTTVIPHIPSIKDLGELGTHPLGRAYYQPCLADALAKGEAL
jgi:DNA primase